MSEITYDAPKCQFQDMPEPPPKYEESKLDSNEEPNKIRVQETGNQQQAVMLVHNGHVVRVDNVTTIVGDAIFGKRTMPFTCPSCMETIMTQTKHRAAPLLVWIPCRMKSCRDVDHICPSCEAYIGTFKRM